jgi:hypothetical protein
LQTLKKIHFKTKERFNTTSIAKHDNLPVVNDLNKLQYYKYTYSINYKINCTIILDKEGEELTDKPLYPPFEIPAFVTASSLPYQPRNLLEGGGLPQEGLMGI